MTKGITMPRRTIHGLARKGATLAAAGVLAVAAAGAAHANVPAPPAASTPTAAPAGANDWNCRPAAAHPRPVVLVHGTWGNQNNWDALAPDLAAQGYCVFTLNYGQDTSSLMGSQPGSYANGDIPTSAREVGAFVDRVRAATGVAQVDVVAHSQGGVVARHYLKFEGGAATDPAENKVRTLVTVAATNHGTTMSGLSELAKTFPQFTGDVEGIVGKAAVQQLVGSPIITSLNDGGDTLPGIDYTVAASHADRISTPPEATFLTAGPGATVRNVWLQDLCPADTTDHGSLPSSPTVAHVVKSALDPSYVGDACSGR